MCLIVCKYMSNRTVHNPNPNPKQLLLISGAITVIFLDEFKRRCKEFHIKERQSSVMENTHSRQTQWTKGRIQTQWLRMKESRKNSGNGEQRVVKHFGNTIQSVIKHSG